MIPWLHPTHLTFPDTATALDEPDGLLAAGGDLTPKRLLAAYRHGIFPWFSDDDPILWWSPNPRCVLLPDQIHISRSMRKHLKKHDYSVTFDTAFSEVIRACASTREATTGTWISADMQKAYSELHQQGHAHSVEVWQNQQLIGGLYGLGIGKLFFGESMFSLQKNASKIAFIALCQQLEKWGYPLIDCQVHNSHLESLGATNIPRNEFIDYIRHYIDSKTSHDWRFDSDKVILNSESG
ncbi:leucyl/phenylalanyl-tRNA--protein transferase [Neptunomonas qingdaonensis]|uniref:Leucyl/phenylalanyl-tRNA--protein transferase n=1 Tax=Neptunomonas qingdaonensis TaxID=1045558 RepID=A0A1I2T0U0_9GAMM|nr:leucyl/phenylalanyl-tRNA--protein transferase [Neptunomonas qingdaonensis]SFG58420.1 leucyl/phenylalanyl-tRNA--protein transferase [Neptunomonas qingdaonensis]